MGGSASTQRQFADSFGKVNFSPRPIQNMQTAYANRPSSAADFFGRSGNGFGLARGINDKYTTNVDGTHSWKGISGILQFIWKFPFGYITNSDWGKGMNQIFWNIILFVIVFGLIYGGMIKSGALSVPEEMAAQTPDPMAQGMYFSVITMTTLGFGDITPATVGGQIVVMLHIILFFLFNFIWTLEFDPTELLK